MRLRLMVLTAVAIMLHCNNKKTAQKMNAGFKKKCRVSSHTSSSALRATQKYQLLFIGREKIPHWFYIKNNNLGFSIS